MLAFRLYFWIVRVLFLTHHYPPELGAAPARIAGLARGLADRGLEVSVHTGFPHYASGRIAGPYRNGRPLLEREEACPWCAASCTRPTHGSTRGLADHATFAAGTLTTARAAGPVERFRRRDAPYVHRRRRRRIRTPEAGRLALGVSDLWPESAIEPGALNHAPQASAAHALARLCYR